MDAETSEVVTIVVKSPYQNFEDQTISCPIEWSVNQLKEEITQTCPTHPSPKEQKLIYWGKLLEDKALLRDTLKIYEEGQANHTVHLILKKDQSHTKVEGLHRRSVNTPPASYRSTASTPLPTPHDPRLFPSMWGPALNPGQFNPAQFNPTQFNPASFTNTTSQNQTPNGPNIQYNFQYPNGYNEQMIAMQQAYVQYMQQYMQFMMGGALPSGFNPAAPQAQPVPANLNNPDAPADERPRDFLDWFYLSSRALIFLTIVCFYSSPFRFLLVLVIGFAIYLYQSGFFRYPGPAVLINDNQPPPVNTPPTHSRTETNTRPNEQEPSATSPTEEPDAANSAAASTAPSQTELPQITISGREEQPTLLTLTWSIVANFFASLLPEQTGIM